MARTTTLVSFIATVAIVVPAGWHALDADLRADGKKLRPLQQEIKIDDVRVTLDLDASIVAPGDPVIAKLVAFSETPKQVTVDLRVLQSISVGEDVRVEPPQRTLNRETIELTAAPDGGKPVLTKLVLGKPTSKLGEADAYRILIAKHGTRPQEEEWDGHKYDQWNNVLYGEDALAAATYVTTWSGNTFGITIGQQTVNADHASTVIVTAKNTTKHSLEEPMIYLAASAQLTADSETGLSIVEAEDDETPEPQYDDDGNIKRTWKPGTTRTKKFTVMPGSTLTDRTITLQANAYTSRNDMGASTGGARVITTLPVARTEDTTVAKN